MDGMKDVIDAGHAVGLPTSVLAIILLSYIIAKEMRLLSRFGPAKSERELLSADQETFRTALMKRVNTLQANYDKMAKANEECEARCAALSDRLHLIMAGIKSSGIDFLMKLIEMDAPLPSDAPQRLTSKKRLWP